MSAPQNGQMPPIGPAQGGPGPGLGAGAAPNPPIGNPPTPSSGVPPPFQGNQGPLPLGLMPGTGKAGRPPGQVPGAVPPGQMPSAVPPGQNGNPQGQGGPSPNAVPPNHPQVPTNPFDKSTSAYASASPLGRRQMMDVWHTGGSQPAGAG